MLDPGTVAAWVGICVTVGGAIAGVAKFSFWIYDEYRARKGNTGFVVPKSTLRLAELPDGNCWWGMGTRRDEPVMQVVGRMLVTNVSPVPARITRTELRFGFLGRKKVAGHAMVSSGGQDNMYGDFDIGPNETRGLSFDFWVFPPVQELGKSFEPRTIEFFDQFGNRHSARRIAFSSQAPKVKLSPDPPEERLYEIEDPIEKNVASVLKAEVRRYAVCGRTVGGLGSVHVVYRGKTMKGMGTDSWSSNSPEDQLLVKDPEAAAIKSDNADALLAYFESLSDENEQARFVSSVVERLGRFEYLSVSYFIVFILMKVGELRRALAHANKHLPWSDSKNHSRGNILMLLNGMLRFDYPNFSNLMLDEIEKAVQGFDQSKFFIPERIAAIRARRIAPQT